MKKKLQPVQALRAAGGPAPGGKHTHPGSSAGTSVGGSSLRSSSPATRGPSAGEAISLGGAVALAGVFLWSYWPTIAGLWSTWNLDQDYSGGKVVPLIAAYLVWSERKSLSRIPIRTCWWGLGVLLFAQIVRLGAVLMSYASFEQYSLVLSVAGAVLLVLGPNLALRLKWILVFLLLMVPLPRSIHTAIALPLQNLATSSAVFGLELLGILVDREGSVLHISDKTSIAVAEACSGLRMLTAFVVVSTVLAFVVRRPGWQKAVLIASSIPVAIGCNTLRLVVTALLYEHASSELAEKFFHDFAGWTMMPVAVGVSLGLLYLLKWLTDSEPATAAPTGKPA